MKKIILSVSTLAFVGVLVAGATYATWSATTTIEGNTVSTATVSLSQTGNIDKPIEGTNMVPGDYTDKAKTGIFNEGTVPLSLHMHTDDLSDTDSSGVCAYTNLSLYTGHANGTPDVDGDGKIIDGENNEAERHIVTKSVLDWMGSGNSEELTDIPPFEYLDANTTQVIWQQAQLDENAPSSVQGQTCTWNEVFVGETI